MLSTPLTIAIVGRKGGAGKSPPTPAVDQQQRGGLSARPPLCARLAGRSSPCPSRLTVARARSPAPAPWTRR